MFQKAMKGFGRIAATGFLLLMALSCSTTRVLQEGEYRLARNRIEVINDSRFSLGEIEFPWGGSIPLTIRVKDVIEAVGG